jgi:type IV pilus assembly protein PilM
MARSVGLDIHERGVRAVEVTGRGKSFRVARYLERSVTPRGGAPDPEELRAALLDIFKSGHLSKNHVISSVEANDTIVREIPVPFRADDQIRKVIKYEAEHHLHDCDADDVVVQYAKVGESAEGTNLLVFAVRKDVIGRRIEYARGAGVEPLAMGLDALALYEAVLAAGLIDESPTCVLLDIGHRATGMVFVVEGAVRALRSVRLGVDSIVHGLARDMEIGLGEADQKLQDLSGDEQGDLLIPVNPPSDKRETAKSHAELERDVFHQKRDEFAARLKREYVRSVAALRGAPTPARVLATGPGLNVPGLLELLGHRLNVPVEAFRPSQAFSCKLDGAAEQFDAGGTVALGLALKGIGRDALGVDFRQEELRVANKFELLKNSLAVTVTLLFLGLLAFSAHCVLKMRELDSGRFDRVLDSAYKAFAPVTEKYNGLGDLIDARYKVSATGVESAGPRPDAVKRFLAELERMKRRLHTIAGDTKGLPPITSALQVWNDIFEVVGKNHDAVDYIDFEKVEITQKRVTLVMILPSVAAAERLQDPLKKVEFLSSMELDDWAAQPITNTPFQRITFNFKRSEK